MSMAQAAKDKIKDVRSSWKEVKQERYIFMNQTENRRLSMKYAQMYKTKKINEKAVDSDVTAVLYYTSCRVRQDWKVLKSSCVRQKNK